MKRDFFLIWGRASRVRNRKVVRPANGRQAELDLDSLKQSPCLRCELFVRDAVCPYVKECSKIDQFQHLAAVHCTLYKPQNVFPIA
jgi:predicted GNAT family N-acyltransferase